MMMEHPGFYGSGIEEGIQIWTIDKFEPVPLDEKDYGNFYTDDSYIVLKTSGKEKLSWDIHFWLGANTSQDKSGAAAILTVILDDMLDGRAVQNREVQGHESSQFLGYFKPAVRYLEGGLDSGFNQVVTNAGAERKLLKLTGTETMRMTEVPADVSSLNKSECFILEYEHTIYVLIPGDAKLTQKRKIILIANGIRDKCHNGRATVEIIDEFSSEEDLGMFFEALGSGSIEDVAEQTDATSEYTREDIVRLYKLEMADGELVLNELSRPYKETQLESNGIFLLDTPNSGLYLWIGKDIDTEVKKSYYSIGQKYLESKDYPSWLHITKVSEGNECSTFIQHFQTWTTCGQRTDSVLKTNLDEGYYSSDSEVSMTSARLIGKSGTARGFSPDQGEGFTAVYRVVSDDEIQELFTSLTVPSDGGIKFGIFFEDECYIVKYNNNSNTNIIYYWTGSNSTMEDRSAAKKLAENMDEELEGSSTLVKVPQGKEPAHFLKIFKGHLIILLGGKSSEYGNSNSKHNYEENNTRLFKIIGTELNVDIRAVQIAENSSSLEEDGVFVLETPDVVYVWNGKDSTDVERDAALSFTQEIGNELNRVVTTIDQYCEPMEFWESLGGPPESFKSGWMTNVSRRINVKATLTIVFINRRGRVTLEQVSNFTQEDLSEDSVFILDSGEEVYFWYGSDVPGEIKQAKDTIIEVYLKNDPSERTPDDAVVISVKQGREPFVFCSMFPEWNLDFWDSVESYEQMKINTRALNC